MQSLEFRQSWTTYFLLLNGNNYWALFSFHVSLTSQPPSIYGPIDSEDAAFIRSAFASYGIHGLQLPLVLAVIISPILLLQGFKAANRATSKLTILQVSRLSLSLPPIVLLLTRFFNQISFCLGNQKPPLLREIESRLWVLLKQVSRDNVSLLSAVFEFFDNLPWNEIEGLAPEDSSFFALGKNSDTHPSQS